MAKKTTRKGKSQTTFLSKNTGKVLLALIATGSFAIAFGSEKISKFIPLQSSSGACLNQFFREVRYVRALGDSGVVGRFRRRQHRPCSRRAEAHNQ